MKNVQLIFSFFRHPQLGLSLDAYLVDLLENGSFSYRYQRLVYERMNDYDYPYTDAERDILKKIGELSQQSIERTFSKKKLKWTTFLEKAAADKELLRALSTYFDRRIGLCLDLLKGSNVYWKERASDHPGMLSFYVAPKPTTIVYHFERQNEGIHYRQEIRYEGRPLYLLRKNTEIISQDPCWMRQGTTIYHFEDGTDGNKLKPFLSKAEIEIPNRLANQFLESFMVKASRKFDVRYTGFNVITQPEQVHALVSIERDLEGRPVLLLGFRYDPFTVTAAQQQEVLVKLLNEDNSYRLLRFNRNRRFETEKAAFLEQLGVVQVKPSWFRLSQAASDVEQLVSWLQEQAPRLEQAGFEVNAGFDGARYLLAVPRIEAREVKQHNDWFDVYAVVLVEGFEIPFVRFRRNILERNRHYLLPDGRTLLLPEAWFVQYADLFEFGETSDTSIRLQRQHEGLLHGHPLLGGDLTLGMGKQHEIIYLSGAEKAYHLPAGLNATLRDYQKRGYDWLCNLREKQLGACLADDMGLGKTIQVIALLQRIKEQASPAPVLLRDQQPAATSLQLDLFAAAEHETEQPRPSRAPSLVVMAPSLVHNWTNELRKFAPRLRVHIHTGQRRSHSHAGFGGADVILTTYGIVRNDIALLRQLLFECVVLDESQLIKNVRSVSFQAVRQLKARQRIVLTGTPVENSLTDLWSQLSFLQPGLLGSFKFFRQEFVLPIEQKQDRQRLDQLRRIIQPFILRRTKEEVAPELPGLTRSVHYCEMAPEQQDYYEEKKSQYRNRILESILREGIDKSQFLILRGIMQLRKIAIHPVLDDPAYSGGSAKFGQVLERLAALRTENRKVLVFSQFVKHLNLFRDHFEEQAIPYSYLTGEIPQPRRPLIINEFDRHEGHRVFLIQLKTGGSGLNLTRADCVFLLDPWWNPAAEEQAISRSHRMGQHQPVFAWRFITTGTIEEKILRLQERKSRLAHDIIEGGNPFGKITEEELRELFG